jgi:hypothetical protein
MEFREMKGKFGLNERENDEEVKLGLRREGDKVRGDPKLLVSLV